MKALIGAEPADSWPQNTFVVSIPRKNTLRSQPRVNPMIKAPRAGSCQHEVAGKRLWILLGLRSHQVAQQKVDYSIVSFPITSWTGAGAFSRTRKRKSMPLIRQVSSDTTSTQSQTTIPTSSRTLMHRRLTVVAAAHARHLPAPFAQGRPNFAAQQFRQLSGVRLDRRAATAHHVAGLDPFVASNVTTAVRSGYNLRPAPLPCHAGDAV